jgi:hypothetical protein
VVLGGENLRVVRFETELCFVLLFLAESVETFHGGAAVRTVYPLAGRAPLKLGSFRRFGQRFACAEQRFHIDAVVDRFFAGGHWLAPW